MKPNKHSITEELISAVSALNTELTYKGKHRKENGNVIYISEAEPLAAHSIEHIQAVFDITNDINEDLIELRDLINKMVVKLGGWDKLPSEDWDNFHKALQKIEKKL